ncbi:MAG: cysteine desulfurase family protein [Acidimicrobiales bacterium]
MSRHYLDHASSSPPRPAVVDAMTRWLTEGSGADPGRLHVEGRVAREMLESARAEVASFLGATPRQVVFTSGGTEAVNTAVFSAWRARPDALTVFAEVEHSSVRSSASRLGETVSVPVDGEGCIDVGAVADVLGAQRGRVSMVHCQLANHEVGTLQPVEEIVALCRDAGVAVHVDACAGAGHVAMSAQALDADFVSVSAHKFGGPAGIGALVVRRGGRPEPLLVGGEQERARRGGLENVAAAIGFAAAASALDADDSLTREATRAEEQRAVLLRAVSAVPGVRVIGHSRLHLPHLLCITIDDVEAEPVLIGLDQSGIAVHSGSSCASETLEPSPVLLAMGVDAQRSLRISVGWSTTDEDVGAFVGAFAPVVGRLRDLRSGAGN